MLIELNKPYTLNFTFKPALTSLTQYRTLHDKTASDLTVLTSFDRKGGTMLTMAPNPAAAAKLAVGQVLMTVGLCNGKSTAFITKVTPGAGNVVR